MQDLSPLQTYPQLNNNEKLADMFLAIQKAAIPSKFTFRFFAKLGFPSSNDRGFIYILEFLGFIDSDSKPTPLYLQLRDTTTFKEILTLQIHTSYSAAFSLNSDLVILPANEKINLFNRLTGLDEREVIKCVNTFNALTTLAQVPMDVSKSASDTVARFVSTSPTKPFAINLTINLPPTSDPAVFDAIFNSIKKIL